MEGYKTPEGYTLRSQEILDFLEKFKPKEYTLTSFNTFHFQVIFLDKNDLKDLDGKKGPDAHWAASTAPIGAYDIYILKSLPKEIKKKKFFHELLEIDLLQQGISADESHLIVMNEEEKFFGKRS